MEEKAAPGPGPDAVRRHPVCRPGLAAVCHATPEDPPPVSNIHIAARWLLSAALAALAACDAGGPARPAQTGPGPAGPAAAPAYGAFLPAAAPDVTVADVRLTTKPVAGGATLADLDRDTDPADSFDPKVPVLFAAPDYPAATAANGALSVRGHSTREAPQKSYKVNLIKTAPKWRGTDEILLNKHPYDRSRMRNKLAFDVLKGLPELAVPQTWFATLAIDGHDYGLFTQVERVDKSFLKRLGGDAEGYLYKAENFEFQRYPDVLKRTTDPGYDAKAFAKRLEINGAKDHDRLITMLDAVNNEQTPINAVIDQHFDRANFITWFAVNVLTDNLDTDSQNYFLYAPRTGGKWTFIPWDYDAAWGYYDQSTRIDRLAQLSRWQEGPSNWWNTTLQRRFLKDPENVRQLVARIDDLADRFFTAERLTRYIQAYRPVVGPRVARQPDAEHLGTDGSGTATTWQTEVDRLAGTVQGARTRFKTAMKRPMPVYLGDERIGGSWRLTWDESYDLQGDALRYDVKIARDPGLTDVVSEKQGLTGTETTVSLPEGTYYWTVTVRDATGEWQVPFTNYADPASQKIHRGVKRLGGE
jgi:spore coat protein H